MRSFAVFVACVGFVATGCGDNGGVVEIANGDVTVRVSQDPAEIDVLRGDQILWQTAPGFAEVGTIATDIDEELGSYRFDEHPDLANFRTVDRLASVSATDDKTIAIASGELSGTVGFDGDIVRIQLATTAGDRVALRAICPTDEHLVGLGGQSFDVDHRGQTVPLWVQEDGIGKDPTPDDDFAGAWFQRGRRHSTHTPMPMMLSSRGYALAVDTNARAIFELGSVEDGVARYEVWQPAMDVRVFAGDPADPKDALGQMIAWVGKPDHPPPAVFAPWIDAVFGSQHVRDVATELRANHIPVSAIWTEDWRGGSDTSTGYALDEDWELDRALYPDFETLVQDLHTEGFSFLVYFNTFLDSTGDVFGEATSAGYGFAAPGGGPWLFTGTRFGDSAMIDLSNPAAVEFTKQEMTKATSVGVDGWMADFGEWAPATADAVLASGEDPLAVHNRYPVDWARVNHDQLATGDPHRLYFMRSAWIHSQPLVQVMWPGDQQTDFSPGDGFPSVVPMGIGLGLTGFPYYGSDVAGYMSFTTVPTSEELFDRWVPFGALSPVMRTHHGRSARDNYQWDHDAGSIAHFKRWAQLHMQLGAYLDGASGEFDQDGMPLVRMIALDYPDEAWAWSVTDEYLLGDRILVAPVMEMGATGRDVQLPAGSWVPLLGGDAVAGGTVHVDAPVTEIPAFVPAGAMLVLYPDGIDTVFDSLTLKTLASIGNDREVWLYPGGGTSTWNDATGATGDTQWTWSDRPAGRGLPASAQFNGVDVPVTADPSGLFATIDVVGDGDLIPMGGGVLHIARAHTDATTHVRIWK